MIDVNCRVVSIVKKNLKINGVRNVEVCWGSFYELVVGEKFDFIIMNFFVYVGKEVLREIVINVLWYLNDGGYF